MVRGLVKQNSPQLLYDGFLYSVADGDLVYTDDGYNNYKFELDSSYSNPTEINKKFVIVKVEISIQINDFEIIYGDFFGNIENKFNKISDDKDLDKAITGPAITIYRTMGESELWHADALNDINTLEQLANSITLNLEDFYGIKRVPAGLYKLEVLYTGNDGNIIDNFDFKVINEATLEVKSRTVYVHAEDSIVKTYGEADDLVTLGVYSTSDGQGQGLVQWDDEDDTLEDAFNPIFEYDGNKVYIFRKSGEDVGTYNFLPETAVSGAKPVKAVYTGEVKTGKTFADYRADTLDTYTNYIAEASTLIRTLEIKPKPITVTALNITKIYGQHDKDATIVGTYSGRLVNNLEGCTTSGQCEYPYIIEGIVKVDPIFVNYGEGYTSIDDIQMVNRI